MLHSNEINGNKLHFFAKSSFLDKELQDLHAYFIGNKNLSFDECIKQIRMYTYHDGNCDFKRSIDSGYLEFDLDHIAFSANLLSQLIGKSKTFVRNNFKKKGFQIDIKDKPHYIESLKIPYFHGTDISKWTFRQRQILPAHISQLQPIAHQVQFSQNVIQCFPVTQFPFIQDNSYQKKVKPESKEKENIEIMMKKIKHFYSVENIKCAGFMTLLIKYGVKQPDAGYFLISFIQALDPSLPIQERHVNRCPYNYKDQIMTILCVRNLSQINRFLILKVIERVIFQHADSLEKLTKPNKYNNNKLFVDEFMEIINEISKDPSSYFESILIQEKEEKEEFFEFFNTSDDGITDDSINAYDLFFYASNL